MKILPRLIPAFVLVGLSLPAFAGDVDFDSITSAATRTGDLSRQLLVMLFGDVVNNPLQPANVSFVGQLFGVFNAILAGSGFAGRLGPWSLTELTQRNFKVFLVKK